MRRHLLVSIKFSDVFLRIFTFFLSKSSLKMFALIFVYSTIILEYIFCILNKFFVGFFLILNWINFFIVAVVAVFP